MKKIALLDGGMGQELLKRSALPASALWSAKVMMDEPQIVEAVHLDYILSGARIITLNSYSATPERLEQSGNGTMFDELQAKAIEIAQSARKKSGKDVKIAGCLPPLVASYRPDLTPDKDVSLEIYRRIVKAQNEGVDFFICETLASCKEIRAATLAASESGKIVWTAMTLADNKNTSASVCLRSAETLAQGVNVAVDAGATALLVNCSWPETLTSAMPILAGSTLPFGAYANGFESIDKLEPGGTVEVLNSRNDLGPEAYGKHAMGWVAAGASIIGGCCETGPQHINELARLLDAAGHEIIGELS